MSIQYSDAVADAVGNIGDTYNITSSNNQFSITVDGGSAQVITLTNGSARTAAQVVTDLSTLTSCTASVVTSNGVNYVRIRGTSSNGASSTLLFNAPSNNSNAILGFVATTYTGGQVYKTTFSTSAQQDVGSGIEDALNQAGWVTIQGHHAITTSGTVTGTIIQSAMSPASQNLRMQVILYSSTNTLGITVKNVGGSKVGTSGVNNGGHLLPGTSKTWTIIADKYQCFVFVAGSTTAREFCSFGIPSLPSFLVAGQASPIYEAIWLSANTTTDSNTTTEGSFRTCLGSRDQANGMGNTVTICNGNLWENANSSSTTGIGLMTLITMDNACEIQNVGTGYQWHDGSAFLTDPIIAWGLTANTDAALGRGQLWDSFISCDAYTIDTTLSSIDSHNWWNITSNNTGGTETARGSLFVATP